MPEFEAAFHAHDAKDLAVIGIHCDPDLTKRNAVIAEKKVTYPICQDEGDRTASSYQVNAFPGVFVIDRKGIIVSVDPSNLERAIKAALARG